ncbi:hypothetical protein [Vulcanisaeta distributa]|uniref:hypothetical protein n=1 Tax=Vulcanisaeta distributa TaxID=164451 RepID=UPI001FB40FDC|nr:hypothetical protein [Vulcanisaeta distributa]
MQPLSVSITWRRGRAVFTSLLEAVDRVAEDLGIRVVLAIDEVQNIISPKLPALLSVRL